MKEYDLVELIKDRDNYKNEGVLKGMFGAVMCEKSVGGKWEVHFGDYETGTIILMVKEEDLKVHESMPRINPSP